MTLIKMKELKAVLFLTTIALLLGCTPTRNKTNPTPERADWWLWAASWHPDKPQIVVGGTQDTLRLFSTKDYSLIRNYPLEGTVTQTAWHPVKNKLAISMQGGKSRSSILNTDTYTRIELDSINDFGARAIGWNNTGKLLAVGDYDGFLLIYDEEGRLVKRIHTGQKSIIGLDWHPSKDLIVAVGENIALFDLKTGALTEIADRKDNVLMLCVAWHPSGDFFVTGDYGEPENGYPTLLQFWTQAGKNMKSIEKSKAEYRNLTWSDDGELLATASESIRLWNKNGDLVAEKSAKNLLWGIDWNKEGTQLVSTDEKGRIQVWDKKLNTLKEIKY